MRSFGKMRKKRKRQIKYESEQNDILIDRKRESLTRFREKETKLREMKEREKVT